MLRQAAIIPGGWSAIIVADIPEDGAPLRPLFVESFEVGRNEPVEGSAKLQRVTTPQDIAGAIQRLVGRAADMHCDSVLIEWAATPQARAHELAAALLADCGKRGLDAIYATKWRQGRFEVNQEWVQQRIAEGYEWWPPDTFSVSRNCGAMLLESLRPTKPQQEEVRHVPRSESQPAPIAAPPETAVGIEPNAVEGLVIRTPSAPSNSVPVALTLPWMPPAPRIAGIDPGSSKLGITIAEGTVAPLRMVLTRTLPVGTDVPLKKPKTIKRGDRTIEITHRHSLTQEMAETLAGDVIRLLREHNVKRIALEHVDAVHLDGSQAGAASSIATALIRSAWVETIIGARAKDAGIEVVPVLAASWRAKVAGRRKKEKGGGGAELIPEAVRAGFVNWPEESDQHERDSGGMCIWLVTPKEEPKPKREPKPRVPSKKNPVWEARLAEWREAAAKAKVEREALGCTCLGKGRHRKACPMAHSTARLVQQDPAMAPRVIVPRVVVEPIPQEPREMIREVMGVKVNWRAKKEKTR